MIRQMVPGTHNHFQVCVDSYLSGVLQGRIYCPYQSADAFDSLAQFLLKMEKCLNAQNLPQAYTAPRRFSAVWQDPEHHTVPLQSPKGRIATFQIQIHFRQHSSWQGTVLWEEHHTKQSFRRVLELIMLMDSALQETERRNLA